MITHQAIETHFIAPTNHRPSRIVATTPSGHRLMLYWDYSLGIEGNHYAAAKALCDKLQWPSIKACGSIKRGMVWVTSILEPEA